MMMDDLETCSWCVEEVPDSTLREAWDGARLCRSCWIEYRLAAAQAIDWSIQPPTVEVTR